MQVPGTHSRLGWPCGQRGPETLEAGRIQMISPGSQGTGSPQLTPVSSCLHSVMISTSKWIISGLQNDTPGVSVHSQICLISKPDLHPLSSNKPLRPDCSLVTKPSWSTNEEHVVNTKPADSAWKGAELLWGPVPVGGALSPPTHPIPRALHSEGARWADCPGGSLIFLVLPSLVPQLWGRSCFFQRLRAMLWPQSHTYCVLCTLDPFEGSFLSFED